MKNEQIPVELSRDRELIYVNSTFNTIQGEGPYAGRKATFIRLQGCNLQCPACDTEYSTGEEYYVSIFLQIFPPVVDGHLIVITGGEPLRQLGVSALCVGLLNKGYTVQIETNGTLPATHIPKRVEIVVSPKLDGIAIPSRRVLAYKYVLHHKHVAEDGLPIQALALKHGGLTVGRPDKDFPRERIYVQPADMQNETINQKNLEACIASVQEHGYTLCLQVHKIINVP